MPKISKASRQKCAFPKNRVISTVSKTAAATTSVGREARSKNTGRGGTRSIQTTPLHHRPAQRQRRGQHLKRARSAPQKPGKSRRQQDFPAIHQRLGLRFAGFRFAGGLGAPPPSMAMPSWRAATSFSSSIWRALNFAIRSSFSFSVKFPHAAGSNEGYRPLYPSFVTLAWRSVNLIGLNSEYSLFAKHNQAGHYRIIPPGESDRSVYLAGAASAVRAIVFAALTRSGQICSPVNHDAQSCDPLCTYTPRRRGMNVRLIEGAVSGVIDVDDLRKRPTNCPSGISGFAAALAKIF